MRNTKVVGFSVPPQIEKKISQHMKKTGKTRSELIREMINLYFDSTEQMQSQENFPSHTNIFELSDRDINKVLQLYYELIGMNKKDVIVVGLGLITSNKRILIGRRKEKDEHVKDLKWVFPGGSMESLDIKKEVAREVNEETGLNVEVFDIVHARLMPDSPEKKVRIVVLYFHCRPLSGEEKPGGDLGELKWVDPTTVCQYFTTSTADEVIEFLNRVKIAG